MTRAVRCGAAVASLAGIRETSVSAGAISRLLVKNKKQNKKKHKKTRTEEKAKSTFDADILIRPSLKSTLAAYILDAGLLAPVSFAQYESEIRGGGPLVMLKTTY